MSLTTVHLQAVEASAQAAAISCQALIAQIAALRAELRQEDSKQPEKPAVELPRACPKCGTGPDLHLPTNDGRTACKACKSIF